MSDQKKVYKPLTQEQYDIELENDHSKQMKKLAVVNQALSKLSFDKRNHDIELYALYDEPYI